MMNIFEALKDGKSLENPAGWKNIQITSSLVGAVMTFIIHILPLFGVTLPIDNDTMQTVIKPVSDGIAAILFIFSAYLTPATSEKVGIPVKEKIEGD